MRFVVLVATAISLIGTGLVTAATKTDRENARVPEVLGFVEWAVLNEAGLRMKARMDTGAKTSSLHAIDIWEFQKNGEKWVKFNIPLGDHEDQPSSGELDHDAVTLQFERPVYRTVLIKRKGLDSQRRYVVKMSFCIAGTEHETQFSLANRSNFSYPMLLGRRFMADDNILIDSSKAFKADKECEYQTLESLAGSAHRVKS